MSIYHDPAVMAILDQHLYNLRTKSNHRLEVLSECGCFFCGRRDPQIVKQYLCNTIFRIAVCEDCQNYDPSPEDYEKHG